MVLLLFFAILYVEVFSLTKWSTGEGRNQNYSSMPKALVMLENLKLYFVDVSNLRGCICP